MTPCQRWRSRRHSYRPPEEVIDTSAHEVAEIPDDTTARRFVSEHHYSGSYPAARRRFGLYRGAELVGVAVFSVPVRAAVLEHVFGDAPALDLGRFVLLDEVPGNGESWFVARCFELLRREGWAGVVAFSDPVRRTAEDGREVMPGHVGTIYQASNAAYLGRSCARRLRLLPDARVLHDRPLQKIRRGERGWRYAVEQLVSYGLPPPRCLAAGEHDAAELAEWLRDRLPKLVRSVRHPGNHKYAWALNKRLRRQLEGGAYPKRIELEQASLFGGVA